MLPQNSRNGVNEESEGTQVEDPSFYKTFTNVEAMLDTRVQKLKASKHLIEAEAKLSLSAILLSPAISLVLVAVVTVIRALLKAGFGFGV